MVISQPTNKLTTEGTRQTETATKKKQSPIWRNIPSIRPAIRDGCILGLTALIRVDQRATIAFRGQQELERGKNQMGVANSVVRPSVSCPLSVLLLPPLSIYVAESTDGRPFRARNGEGGGRAKITAAN